MRLIRKNYRDRRTYMLAAVDISSRRESTTSYRLGVYLVLYEGGTSSSRRVTVTGKCNVTLGTSRN